jgi:hypothetical protein
VSDEDAKMAEFIMEQMNAQDEREFTGSLRESELGRRRAADEMMIPQGQGGGSISFTGGAGGPSAETRFGSRGPGWEQGAANAQTMPVGGGMPTGPPPGPPATLTEGQGLVAAAGSFPEPRSTSARAQGEGYGNRGTGRTSAGQDTFRKEMGKLGNELDLLETDIMEVARTQRGWEELPFKEIIRRSMDKPDSIPREFRRELEHWFAKADQLKTYMGGGQGQAEPERWTPGG